MHGESLKTKFFRYGINLYPMFFGTGGKVTFIKGDWTHATVRLKLNLWTRNYVGTIFGGSQFAAADPFHKVLLINCIGKEFIVWDKAATIIFKKPGKGVITADFIYTPEELESIKQHTLQNGSYEFKKTVSWIDQHGDTVSTFEKTVYVATKEHFNKRRKEKENAAVKN